MAIVVNTTLKADTTNAVKEVEKLNKEVEKVQKNAKKAGEELTEGMVVGNAVVKQVDKVTGGLASALVKVAKAAKLSGKAMRVALLSTGIGAVVIAVGLLVEYWDQIGEALGFINKDLEKQIELNSENLDIADRRLRNVKTYIELQKREGKNVDELLEKEKELTEQKRLAFIQSLDSQKILVNRLRLKQQEGKLNEEETKELQKQEGVYLDLINSFNKFKSDLLKPVKEVVPKAKDVKEDPEVEAKAKSIEEITKLEDEFLQSQLDKQTQEENAVLDKYFTQIQAAKDLKLDTTLLEEARQKELQDIRDKYAKEKEEKEKERLKKIQDIVDDATELTEIEKIQKDKQAALEELDLLEATWIEKARIAAYYQGLINDATTKQNKETNDKQKEDDEKLQDAKFRVASQTIDAISSLGNLFAGENEKNAKIAFKISKAVGIAQTGINTAQAIMKVASESTDITPTQSLRTANMVAMGVAGAAQIASIAAQKFEGGSSTVPKPSLGGGSQAPAFNIVGASGETQLADAIGGQMQRPARAYVVSNDVTTAQEMDRNIIEGASIG